MRAGTRTTGRDSGLRGRATRPQNYGIEHRETHGNRASYRGAFLDTTLRAFSAERAVPGVPDRVKVASPAVKDPGQKARSERVSRPARPSDPELLDLDRGAGALEGRLGLLGVFLVGLLQDRLGSGLDQVLGLLEAQAREGTHLLDDLDLLVAGRGEDDVEVRLLLVATAGVATGSRGGRCGHGHGRSRGHAELLL